MYILQCFEVSKHIFGCIDFKNNKCDLLGTCCLILVKQMCCIKCILVSVYSLYKRLQDDMLFGKCAFLTELMISYLLIYVLSSSLLRVSLSKIYKQ